MIRTLTLASALLAVSLSASALSAQTAAPSSPKPATTPTMNHAPAPTPAHHAAWTTDQIKAAQEGLTKAGDYRGKVTGVFDQDTRKALRAYQKQNKLPVTGHLSDGVLARLKAA